MEKTLEEYYEEQFCKINKELLEIRKSLDAMETRSKLDLDHELFFGLVLALGILFITLPTNMDIQHFFIKYFPGISNSMLYSQSIRFMIVGSLLLSSLYRYIGVIYNSMLTIALSVSLFLLSLGFMLQVYWYGAVCELVSSFIPFRSIPLMVIYIFNLKILLPLEIGWVKRYVVEPQRLISSYALIGISFLWLCSYTLELFISIINIHVPLSLIKMYSLFISSLYIYLYYQRTMPTYFS